MFVLGHPGPHRRGPGGHHVGATRLQYRSADDHDGTADDHDRTADDHDGTADDHDGTADDHDGAADDHCP